MEEKVIIQSSRYNVKKFSIILVLIGIVLSIILFIGMFVDYYSRYIEIYHNKAGYLIRCPCLRSDKYKYNSFAEDLEELKKIHPSVISYIKCVDGRLSWLDDGAILHGMFPLLSMSIIAGFLYWLLSSYQLTVTDKRVYGKAAFGKRVDLPINKISAVGTSFLKGIDVGTSSGKIKFKLIKNQKDIHFVLSKLLMERQEDEKSKAAEKSISTSNADELKKFKDLLDSGVITQEEFDAKKKHLLGL